MNADQAIIFVILATAMILFLWGRWRYDFVAFSALVIAVIIGLIPAEDAFLGFGHPAVITVALVLLISKALEKSGFINMIGDLLRQMVSGEMQFLIILMLVAGILSSFMNNIGAMAMLLPITIGIAQKMEWNPSKFLMPLAFASILGGMNTKIGTPPNIIISEFREDYSSQSFEFFDFAFAGLPISVIGIFFIAYNSGKFIFPSLISFPDFLPVIIL